MERHKLEYKVLNDHNPGAESGGHWNIEVHASPEELQVFAEMGYLVREGLFQGTALQKIAGCSRWFGGTGMGKTRQRDGWKTGLGFHSAPSHG